MDPESRHDATSSLITDFSQLHAGIGYSAGAGFSFAVAAIMVKIASGGFGVLAVLWARGIVQLSIVGMIFAMRRESPWGPAGLRWWLTLRGSLGVLAIVGYMAAIVALPVADAISLFSVKPVLTSFLAALCLKEPLHHVHCFASVLSVVGCVLVAQAKSASGSEPVGDQRMHVAASIVVIVAALLAAGTTVVTRRIMSRSAVSPEVPVWYFCVVDVVLLLVLTPSLAYTKYAKQGWDWTPAQLLALLCVPVFSVLGQHTMTVGLKHVPAALNTVLVQTETVHVFVFQWLLYGQLSWWSMAGASLICLATALLARYEMHSAARIGRSPIPSPGPSSYTVVVGSQGGKQ